MSKRGAAVVLGVVQTPGSAMRFPGYGATCSAGTSIRRAAQDTPGERGFFVFVTKSRRVLNGRLGLAYGMGMR